MKINIKITNQNDVSLNQPDTYSDKDQRFILNEIIHQLLTHCAGIDVIGDMKDIGIDWLFHLETKSLLCLFDRSTPEHNQYIEKKRFATVIRTDNCDDGDFLIDFLQYFNSFDTYFQILMIRTRFDDLKRFELKLIQIRSAIIFVVVVVVVVTTVLFNIIIIICYRI